MPLKRTILLGAALLVGGACRHGAEAHGSSKRVEVSALGRGGRENLAVPVGPPSATQEPRDSLRKGEAHTVTRLEGAQRAALNKRFPHAEVQSAITAEARTGAQVFALIWEAPPKLEDRCPPENDWTAYDIQSCSGFAGSLAGSAVLVRFAGDALVDTFALDQFFQHDANPSGVEKAGKRGQRHSFIPKDYALEPRDLNADGFSNEFLFHVGNGPYAMMTHWVAVGLLRDKLDAVRSASAEPIIATREAWFDLARTGRGTSELYCGTRCANTARRWTLARAPSGTITERRFWTCTPDEPTSWKQGEQTVDCEQ